MKSKIKIKKKDIFFFLLIATYTSRAITDAIFVAQNVNSIWVSLKYVLLLITMAYGSFVLLQNKKEWKSLYLVKYVGITVAMFALISAIRMIHTGVFSTAVFAIAFKMIFPAFVAVLVVSIGDSEDVFRCFAWILIITLVTYCTLEKGLDLFSEDTFSNISFETSSFSLESHYTSGTAAALCGFFSYYRKNKLWAILALVFSVLTFKRVYVIMSIVIFVLPWFVNMRKRTKPVVRMLAAWGFVAATLVYAWMMIPENHGFLQDLFNIESVYDFTSSRSAFFESVYSDPFFVNFGWGACENQIGKMFEMDLIQMLIEVSVVGLVTFSLCYWKIAGATRYSVILMAWQFVNMLGSHSLAGGFIWLILLVTFAQIESDSLSSCVKKR